MNVISADELTANNSLLPEVVTVFEGPSGGGSPPDTEIAVSSRAIVTVENHKLNVFNKSDGEERLAIPFTNFFPVESFQDRSPYDPHVEYDPINKKFVAVVGAKFNTTSNGYMGLIIGKNDNPTNNTDWCGIKFNNYIVSGKTLFMDYPGLAISPQLDLIVLTANIYDMKATSNKDDDVALGAIVFKMRLSTAYQCITPGAIITFPTTIPNTKCNGNDSPCLAESLHPAQWLDNFSSDKIYLLSHVLQDNIGGTELYTWAFDTSFTSQNGLELFSRVGYTYQKSPGIRQIGGQTLAMNNSPFISHVYYKNNTLYATQDIKNPDANNSAVVFHTIPVGGAGPSITRKNNDRDYAFQSVMLDKHNNIALGFNQTQFVNPTINFAISVSGLTNEITPIKENEANITDPNKPPRGGDYSDAYLDPDGYHIWMINSYGAANNFWKSKIIKLSFIPRIFVPLIIKE